MLMIIEDLLTPAEVSDLCRDLTQANWVDGAQSAGSRSVKVKQNQQVERSDPLGLQLSNRLLARFGEHPQFVSATLAQKIWPPMFNRYTGGGHYGLHVDAALMHHPELGLDLRSDISGTLFLNDPDEYEGGELQIETAFGAQSVKLPKGHMVLYPSSSLHQVTPVTRGERVAAVTWIQSSVADDSARAMLFELDQSIQSLSAQPDNQIEVENLVRLYHNLLRRWASA